MNEIKTVAVYSYVNGSGEELTVKHGRTNDNAQFVAMLGFRIPMPVRSGVWIPVVGFRIMHKWLAEQGYICKAVYKPMNGKMYLFNQNIEFSHVEAVTDKEDVSYYQQYLIQLNRAENMEKEIEELKVDIDNIGDELDRQSNENKRLATLCYDMAKRKRDIEKENEDLREQLRLKDIICSFLAS